jgi:uncharacterized protein DUF4383
MLERIAIGWGVALVVVGALGFVPAVAPMGAAGHPELFGLFAVNAAHNVVHVLSGLFALAVGFSSEAASRIYFRVFGILYGLLAVVGFFAGGRELLGVVAHNLPDAVLHLVIAAGSLFLGFARLGAPLFTGIGHRNS